VAGVAAAPNVDQHPGGRVGRRPGARIVHGHPLFPGGLRSESRARNTFGGAFGPKRWRGRYHDVGLHGKVCYDT
jgi:hypothetical protein